VYLDVIENKTGKFGSDKKISSLAFYSFLETLTGFDFVLDGMESQVTGTATYSDLLAVAKILKDIEDTAQPLTG
jgi:hypothetical protein